MTTSRIPKPPLPMTRDECAWAMGTLCAKEIYEAKTDTPLDPLADFIANGMRAVNELNPGPKNDTFDYEYALQLGITYQQQKRAYGLEVAVMAFNFSMKHGTPKSATHLQSMLEQIRNSGIRMVDGYDCDTLGDRLEQTADEQKETTKAGLELIQSVQKKLRPHP